MAKTNAASHGRYRTVSATHWFWNEDVPSGAVSITVAECQQRGISPHEQRIAGNDRPAARFSDAYYLLDPSSARDLDGA